MNDTLDGPKAIMVACPPCSRMPSTKTKTPPEGGALVRSVRCGICASVEKMRLPALGSPSPLLLQVKGSRERLIARLLPRDALHEQALHFLERRGPDEILTQIGLADRRQAQIGGPNRNLTPRSRRQR